MGALLALYLAVAVFVTWPLAARASDHVFGLGTPPLNVWAIGVVLRQLFRDPLRLFDGNAFHPYPDTLALSEHLFAPALLGAPVAWLTGNLVLTHNVVALVSYALAGVGMFLLARELTGHSWGSLIAGLFYAAHTWNVNELIRLQIISNQWFPFLILALVRYFRRPSPGGAGAAAVFYLLQSLSCMYWALYAPLLVLPLLGFLQWRHRLGPRAVLHLAAGLGCAGLLLLPFARPYLEQAAAFGLARELPPPVGLDRYLDVLPGNWLFADLLGTARPNRDAPHFLGFVTMGLALLGAVRGGWRGGGRSFSGFFALLAVAGILLSLGPELLVAERSLGPGPYRLLRELVPGFGNVRYPERFALFVALAVAPLAAAGAAAVGRLPRIAWGALAALALLEHVAIPLPLTPLPTGDQVPQVHRWIASQDDIDVVAQVPSGHYWLDRVDAVPMYLSTFHWKRTVQGLTGYYPPAQSYVRWRLFHFPRPASVRFLKRFGVDAVIAGPRFRHPAERVARAVADPASVAFSDGHHLFRLRSSEELLAPPPPDRTDLVELPRKGWLVQGSHDGARFAVDDDAATVWTTGREQRAKDYFLVRLAGREQVARISLAVSSPFHFPTSLRLFVRVRGEGRHEVALDLEPAYDRMFRELLHEPRTATLDLDLPDLPMDAFQLVVAETDRFQMPWALPDIRVYVRRPADRVGP